MRTKINLTPAQLGFRMPAEWETHEATWLSWPRDLETWPRLEEVEATYVEIIEQLHTGEKVHILVENAECEDRILKILRERGVTKNINSHVVDTDSIWIRDYGPMFISHANNLSMINWSFNAWGRKYPYQKDKLVPGKLAEILNIKQFKADLVLEGGSIELNGEGTLMTTEECLLNPNRNPGLRREQIEECLKDFLGARKIIWLGKGIEGDDTDGHIDEVARFVAPDKIVINTNQDANSYNHKVLKENWQRLQNETTPGGKCFQLIELPMPERIVSGKMTLPGSYTNFYIGNKCVLVPIFSDKKDTKALGILKDLFSDRNVVGIPAIPLIHGQGAIHCMTQQEPAHAA